MTPEPSHIHIPRQPKPEPTTVYAVVASNGEDSWIEGIFSTNQTATQYANLYNRGRKDYAHSADVATYEIDDLIPTIEHDTKVWFVAFNDDGSPSESDRAVGMIDQNSKESIVHHRWTTGGGVTHVTVFAKTLDEAREIATARLTDPTNYPVEQKPDNSLLVPDIHSWARLLQPMNTPFLSQIVGTERS